MAVGLQGFEVSHAFGVRLVPPCSGFLQPLPQHAAVSAFHFPRAYRQAPPPWLFAPPSGKNTPPPGLRTPPPEKITPTPQLLAPSPELQAPPPHLRIGVSVVLLPIYPKKPQHVVYLGENPQIPLHCPNRTQITACQTPRSIPASAATNPKYRKSKDLPISHVSKKQTPLNQPPTPLRIRILHQGKIPPRRNFPTRYPLRETEYPVMQING